MINQMPIILDKWEKFRASKNRRKAWFMGQNFRAYPCRKCGLFGCICQASLDDFIHVKPVMLKDTCPICGLFLCDCPRDCFGKLIITPKK